MKEIKTIYRCDYCGTRMDSPYVTLTPEYKDETMPKMQEYHYCFYCWANHVIDFLMINKKKALKD